MTCPVTDDWCTRQCSLLCDRVGERVEPDPEGVIDCTGYLSDYEIHVLDSASWPAVEPDPMDLGETVPWPMDAA